MISRSDVTLWRRYASSRPNVTVTTMIMSSFGDMTYLGVSCNVSRASIADGSADMATWLLSWKIAMSVATATQ